MVLLLLFCESPRRPMTILRDSKATTLLTCLKKSLHFKCHRKNHHYQHGKWVDSKEDVCEYLQTTCPLLRNDCIN